MRIERATRDDLLTVARAMREQDFAEFAATSHAEGRNGIAEMLAARYGGREDVLVGRNDEGDPVCIGGTIEAWPNVITLLFFATDDFPKIGLPMTRWIKRELFPRYLAAGVHRIQAVSHGEHAAAHAWLRTLGLREEVRLEGFGKNGETFLQFAMLKGA